LDSPTASPKKLKRPSTLTGHDRQLALLRAQIRARDKGLTINAADPSKPCPFAALPTEIREIIYEYTFPPVELLIRDPEKRQSRNRALWPALLRVSSRVRYEAAYVFFARSKFQAEVYNLDFSHITGWVESLSIEHRFYLTKNQNISITMIEPEIPPAVTRQVWAECRRFGNLYIIKHKAHFISFGRLANWFLWCSKPIQTAFQFNYKIPYNRSKHYWTRGDYWSRSTCSWAYMAVELLKHDVGSFTMPCTQIANLSNEQKKLMKKEALRMVESLDKSFWNAFRAAPSDQLLWHTTHKSVKQYFEKW
jgi:hypothetical protein